LFKGQYIGKGFFLILTRSYPELLLSAFLSTVQNFKKLKGMGAYLSFDILNLDISWQKTLPFLKPIMILHYFKNPILENQNNFFVIYELGKEKFPADFS